MSTPKPGGWPAFPRLVLGVIVTILVWLRGEWDLGLQTQMEAGKGPVLEIPTS